MLAHQSRMIDELRILDDRIQKLRSFINSNEIFNTLDPNEQQDQKDQLNAMEIYSDKLTSRCKRANILK